ncbi:DUF6382 domain-containing protein [Petrocella sp. FN5]|uniref:DUF6382 domain-containing protein n=1 Tax=Petrocella sp. FN5 TaxID=3032002 RepID=UPI0023DAF6D0|nr:DUF6382 domain-containing protein [Petrocella sp. FN5]MDF1617098.1 DUF6382 domain-containing protein [Petrocella sp. FN5]
MIEIYPLEKCIYYQIKMCQHNQISSLIPFEYSFEEDDIKIYWKLKGFEALHKKDKNTYISKRKMEKLLLHLKGALTDCMDYMLEPCQLKLQWEAIYVDQSDNYRFIYLPVRNEEEMNIAINLKGFLSQLQPYINLGDEDVMIKMHQLRLSLEAEDFNLDTFIHEALSSSIGSL